MTTAAPEMTVLLPKDGTGSCGTCMHLGSDGDGPEYNGSWPVCNKVERYTYLKSFPFKKPMACHRLGFWHSPWSDLVGIGCKTQEELDASIRDAFAKYWAWFETAYPEGE